MEVLGEASHSSNSSWTPLSHDNMYRPSLPSSSSPIELARVPSDDPLPRISNSLVRSESLPSNLLDSNVQDFCLLGKHMGADPESASASSLRLSFLQSSPRPISSRSLSSVELTDIDSADFPCTDPQCLPTDAQAVIMQPFSNDFLPSSEVLKSKPVQPRAWHKSVFDMIQDDFPRTPAPVLSSVTPQRPSCRASEPTHPRRSRLASSSSLDVEFDHLHLTHNVLPDESQFSRKHGNCRSALPLSRTHRRSASVNWTSRTHCDRVDKEDMTSTPYKSHSILVPAQPRPSSFFPPLSPDQTSPVLVNPPVEKTPARKQLSRSSSSPHSLAASHPKETSDISQCPGPPATVAAKHPIENSTISPSFSVPVPPHHFVSSRTSGTASPKKLDSRSECSQSQIIYRQSSTLHQSSSIPLTVLDSAHHAIPEQSRSHSTRSTLPQETYSPTPSSFVQSPSPIPRTGVFPAPDSTNSLSTSSALNTIYPASFHEPVLATDSWKNMNIQMTALMAAHQQLYAAQMTQMAATTGRTTFSNNFLQTSSAPFDQLFETVSSPATHSSSWGASNGNITNRIPQGLTERVHYNNGASRNVRRYNTITLLDTQDKNRVIRNRRSYRGNGDNTWIGNRTADRSYIGNTDLSTRMIETIPARSALLEEFRSTSFSIGRSTTYSSGSPGLGRGTNGGISYRGLACREWELSEISENVVEFATDQHGSRFIQQKLESASNEDRESILRYALVDAHRLMTDVFGNYVVQKLLDYGGTRAIDLIACELKGRMLVLSLHMYGCRVVQKALEVLEPSSRATLVHELDGHVLKCIRDQNGNHVVQKCVELVEPNSVQFVVNSVHGQAVSLAGHSYGCRVVQRILEYGAPSQKAPIMLEIMSSIANLIKDQYGNYVIQHIVEHGTIEERSIIINLVRREVCDLSKHKFASNVVERCLQFGSLVERGILIEILIGRKDAANYSPLYYLVRDQFGNYVVQRVLDVALAPQREQVVTILRAQVPAIKKYSYGKHIIARLELHHESGINRQTNTNVKSLKP